MWGLASLQGVTSLLAQGVYTTGGVGKIYTTYVGQSLDNDAVRHGTIYLYNWSGVTRHIVLRNTAHYTGSNVATWTNVPHGGVRTYGPGTYLSANDIDTGNTALEFTRYAGLRWTNDIEGSFVQVVSDFTKQSGQVGSRQWVTGNDLHIYLGGTPFGTIKGNFSVSTDEPGVNVGFWIEHSGATVFETLTQASGRYPPATTSGSANLTVSEGPATLYRRTETGQVMAIASGNVVAGQVLDFGNHTLTIDNWDDPGWRSDASGNEWWDDAGTGLPPGGLMSGEEWQAPRPDGAGGTWWRGPNPPGVTDGIDGLPNPGTLPANGSWQPVPGDPGRQYWAGRDQPPPGEGGTWLPWSGSVFPTPEEGGTGHYIRNTPGTSGGPGGSGIPIPTPTPNPNPTPWPSTEVPIPTPSTPGTGPVVIGGPGGANDDTQDIYAEVRAALNDESAETDVPTPEPMDWGEEMELGLDDAGQWKESIENTVGPAREALAQARAGTILTDTRAFSDRLKAWTSGKSATLALPAVPIIGQLPNLDLSGFSIINPIRALLLFLLLVGFLLAVFRVLTV